MLPYSTYPVGKRHTQHQLLLLFPCLGALLCHEKSLKEGYSKYEGQHLRKTGGTCCYLGGGVDEALGMMLAPFRLLNAVFKISALQIDACRAEVLQIVLYFFTR